MEFTTLPARYGHFIINTTLFKKTLKVQAEDEFRLGCLFFYQIQAELTSCHCATENSWLGLIASSITLIKDTAS